jgi:phage terminase small subunit
MAKKELTEQQKRFLEVLFAEANGNISQAMKMAGFSEGYSRRQLTNSLKEEIIEATQLYIAMAAPKAAVAMINAIDDPTELGLKEKMSAAKDLLDRAGLVKTEKVQVESNTGGVMILPAKEREEE